MTHHQIDQLTITGLRNDIAAERKRREEAERKWEEARGYAYEHALRLKEAYAHIAKVERERDEARNSEAAVIQKSLDFAAEVNPRMWKAEKDLGIWKGYLQEERKVLGESISELTAQLAAVSELRKVTMDRIAELARADERKTAELAMVEMRAAVEEIFKESRSAKCGGWSNFEVRQAIDRIDTLATGVLSSPASGLAGAVKP